mmetsp:Transcript_1268/g.4978  ORF Transcript_1268/g.4978 Transcript_1268/m.4978 type:complete len:384 (+) Transcript_1268:4411-5562(+)
MMGPTASLKAELKHTSSIQAKQAESSSGWRRGPPRTDTRSLHADTTAASTAAATLASATTSALEAATMPSTRSAATTLCLGAASRSAFPPVARAERTGRSTAAALDAMSGQRSSVQRSDVAPDSKPSAETASSGPTRQAPRLVARDRASAAAPAATSRTASVPPAVRVSTVMAAARRYGPARIVSGLSAACRAMPSSWRSGAMEPDLAAERHRLTASVAAAAEGSALGLKIASVASPAACLDAAAKSATTPRTVLPWSGSATCEMSARHRGTASDLPTKASVALGKERHADRSKESPTANGSLAARVDARTHHWPAVSANEMTLRASCRRTGLENSRLTASSRALCEEAPPTATLESASAAAAAAPARAPSLTLSRTTRAGGA